MRPLRSALLRASTSARLARRLPQLPFARRAVSRFMPGESLEDALAAAVRLRAAGIPGIVTQLGENVADERAVEGVVAHYLSVMERIAAGGLDCHVSVKPTQLGLDLGVELCGAALGRLAAAAESSGNMLWIDMESSAYTDATIDLFRTLRREHTGVGLCLQANLRRTEQDLAGLLPIAPSIRLVKGAYAEPGSVAYPRKRDVDAAFLRLAQRLLRQPQEDRLTGIATHDLGLIRRIETAVHGTSRSRDGFELQMLYGIRAAAQQRLAAEGFRVRVLISYGAHWFPWYMRRLAERPANLWFVARSVFGR
jgi:proline dehydrogenase